MQWKPNVTVAAIIQKNNKFLLVEELVDNDIVINQPAGHLESNETLIDAIKREVFEETAWHFNPKGLSGIYLFKNIKNNITYLRFCFYGECLNFDEHAQLDSGIIRTIWISINDLKSTNYTLRTPVVQRCIDDYLSGNSISLDILKDYN
jgi:ADP-ribose pyrophosphatase YjhB (NUDIX family)